MATNSNSRKRGQNKVTNKVSEVEQPKKKRQRKVMNKKTRETLQDSLKSIDSIVLVHEVMGRLREEFESDSTHLTSLANTFCDEKLLFQELVEFHRDTFVTLHIQCKKEKNSQLQFQRKWLLHCSVFLLEEQYSLAAINLEETAHPVLAELRQKWLGFCKEHGVTVTSIARKEIKQNGG